MPLEAPPLASPTVRAREVEQQATAWLVISLASSVLCVSLCLGLIGATFCYLALQAARRGLMQDAQDKLRWGRIVTLVGSVLGVVATSLALILR